MGRKKKKQLKPWCWYCNREFDDEKILIQHQKAKHFKCHICHKKLYTGPGLSIHCMQVHKEKVDKVPNALPGRNNIEIEIYGMEGIPEEDMKEHEKHKLGKDDQRRQQMDSDDEGSGTPNSGYINGIPGQMASFVPPAAANAPNIPPLPPGPSPMGGHMGPMGPLGPIGPMPPVGPMGPMTPMGMHPNSGPPGMPGMSIPHRPMMPQVSRPSNLSQPPTASHSAPQKPLFPAAGQTRTSSSGPVGPDFKPMSTSTAGSVKPTFPAAAAVSSVSSSATISGAPMIRKPESTSGLTSKLMHPDEDISLEERRANLPKYKNKMSQVATSAAVSSSVSRATMQAMMNSGMIPGQNNGQPGNPRVRHALPPQGPVLHGMPGNMPPIGLPPGAPYSLPYQQGLLRPPPVPQGGRF